MYEKEIRAKIDGWHGFDVVGGKPAATAAAA